MPLNGMRITKAATTGAPNGATVLPAVPEAVFHPIALHAAKGPAAPARVPKAAAPDTPTGLPSKTEIVENPAGGLPSNTVAVHDGITIAIGTNAHNAPAMSMLLNKQRR